MTWVRLDDKFWSNPKIQEVGNEAAGAYARMLSFCGDHLTDGKIPTETARFIAGKRALDKLTAAGFLHRNGRGFEIPDFLEFNPSRKDVESKRAADRARKAKG